MKQSLQIKLGQSLTMTPQLQQAIRLLQLSSLELQQEIQSMLESNPLLELMEFGESPEDGGSLTEYERERLQQTTNEVTDFSEPESVGEADESWREDTIPEDLPVDTQWDDVFQPAAASGGSGNDEDSFEERNAQAESLQSHLLWQLNLTPMSDRDRLVAMAIIDAVAPNGFLDSDIEDIHIGLVDQLQRYSDREDWEADPLEFDEVMAVLRRVQQFEPAGVCARNLSECLMIQLNQLHPDTPWLLDAKEVVGKHLALLAVRDYRQLMRKADIRENTLKKVIELIQSLNPTPGAAIETERTEYVVPDVFVSRRSNRWVVELNPELGQRLCINNQYAAMIRRADSSADNQFIRDNLQEARWFLKCLESRNETLMKVATAIVEHQRGFLEYGEEAMKPLVLAEVADRIGMHESTVSRVTSNKYLRTPRGVFELKYFFSSHVGAADNGECSSTAVRTMIKKLIADENPKKPLSDSALTTLLEAQGVNVARRTVAKYREAMNIPPSNERKQLV